mmetsp:Transcript_47020/g.152606  ORF Transcript_47020/g.152606 Transcript_47020/m.152606 type:complete len:515 (-) Transcript_47020:17-1561(-)
MLPRHAAAVLQQPRVHDGEPQRRHERDRNHRRVAARQLRARVRRRELLVPLPRVVVVVGVPLKLEQDCVAQPRRRVPRVAQADLRVAPLDWKRRVARVLAPLEAVVFEVVDRLEEQHRGASLDQEEGERLAAEAEAHARRHRNRQGEELEQLVRGVQKRHAGLCEPLSLQLDGGAQLADHDAREEVVEGLTGASRRGVLLRGDHLVVPLVVFDVEVWVEDADKVEDAEQSVELGVAVAQLVRVGDAEGARVDAEGDPTQDDLHRRELLHAVVAVVAKGDDQQRPGEPEELEDGLCERGKAKALGVELVLWRRRAAIGADDVLGDGEQDDDIGHGGGAPAAPVNSVGGERSRDSVKPVLNCSIVVVGHPAEGDQAEKDADHLKQVVKGQLALAQWLVERLVEHRDARQSADEDEGDHKHGEPGGLDVSGGAAAVDLGRGRPELPMLSELRRSLLGRFGLGAAGAGSGTERVDRAAVLHVVGAVRPAAARGRGRGGAARSEVHVHVEGQEKGSRAN